MRFAKINRIAIKIDAIEVLSWSECRLHLSKLPEKLGNYQDIRGTDIRDLSSIG